MMLEPILAGGENCHRLVEVVQTLSIAKQAADRNAVPSAR